MHEIFEHTADLGLRVRANDLPELFVEAGKGLFAMIVSNPDEIGGGAERRLEIAGQETDYLLFDWLNELLILFEVEHFVAKEFDVQITANGMLANIRGEPLDPLRHRLEHEVKAITYHGLKVERRADGWLAEIIVDI